MEEWRGRSKTVDEVEELALDESMDAPGQCLPPAGSPPEGCTCLASSILELPCGVPGTTAQLGRATGSCSLPSLSKLGPAEPAMMRYKGTRNVASGPLKVQSRDAPGLGVDVLRHRHPRYPQHRTRPAEIYAQRAQPAQQNPGTRAGARDCAGYSGTYFVVLRPVPTSKTPATAQGTPRPRLGRLQHP